MNHPCIAVLLKTLAAKAGPGRSNGNSMPKTRQIERHLANLMVAR
jgi:hypothetical protein